MSKKIAIVGSGVAGLSCAWLLSQQYDITLFERGNYFGGHSNTVEVNEGGHKLAIDTGFIVYNERNYPLLVGLFERLQIPTQASDMSFAVSISNKDLEYAGDNIDTLFAQRRNLLRPAFVRMLIDIIRFNRQAKHLLKTQGFANQTVQQFLHQVGYSEAFRDQYLLPMAAAIWSAPPKTMLEFPAESLARFLYNHGLLSVLERPPWRTVAGGAQVYVKRMRQDIGHSNTHLDGVKQVRRTDQGVEIALESGATAVFDEVVLACHADQALALLTNPSTTETELLGQFHYQANRAYLHQDTNLMPRLRKAWSAWNYLSFGKETSATAFSVTYWMNRLQNLDTQQAYFVSLNPPIAHLPQNPLACFDYHHPVFDWQAMNAQQHLSRIQGVDRLWFCGSYFGYGFHEDALRSAVNVATRIGIDTAWLQQHPTNPAGID